MQFSLLRTENQRNVIYKVLEDQIYQSVDIHLFDRLENPVTVQIK